MSDVALIAGTEQAVTTVVALLMKADVEPLEVDISDMSDEWCMGFLAGQQNVVDLLERADVAIATPSPQETEGQKL